MRNYVRLPSGTVPRARELRRHSTDAEKKLWRALRENFRSARFRRQVPFGSYFVDFLSFSARLVIEVDGGQHAGAAGYDAARSRYIEGQGYRVLRFWNHEVLENLDGVLTTVASHLSPSPSQALPGPSAGCIAPRAMQVVLGARPTKRSLPTGEGFTE